MCIILTVSTIEDGRSAWELVCKSILGQVCLDFGKVNFWESILVGAVVERLVAARFEGELGKFAVAVGLGVHINVDLHGGQVLLDEILLVKVSNVWQLNQINLECPQRYLGCVIKLHEELLVNLVFVIIWGALEVLDLEAVFLERL